MRKIISAAILFVLLLGTGAGAQDIGSLLDAVANQPGIETAEVAVQESALREKAVGAALYPKINIWGKADEFNSPTNLRPMAPTEVNIAGGASIPFSKDILRYGLTMQAPLYMKEIGILRDKVGILTEGTALKLRISLVSSQAQVVSLNSAYLYLESLSTAIDARLESLGKLRDDVALKVDTGRTAEAELMKIETTINNLEQQRNELSAKTIEVRSAIKKLTGVDLEKPAPMSVRNEVEAGPYIAVAAQSKKLEAARKELEARRAARLPTLSLFGMVSGNQGNAYNTGSHIYRNYSSIGLMVNYPVFDKTLSANEKVAAKQVEKSRTELDDTKAQIEALEAGLREKLPVIEHSISLAEKSVEYNKQLLEVAKVAYDTGRMTMEEYLRYESQLLASQADLNKSIDERWQVISRLAVIYGTDLKEVVQ